MEHTAQKDYNICVKDFGLENFGKKTLIRTALYIRNSTRHDFKNNLRGFMRHINFDSCPADTDIMMRLATKDDGLEYYEYVLLYNDNALVISETCSMYLENTLEIILI